MATAILFIGFGHPHNVQEPEKAFGWLASEGMGTEKIASFYADPVKQACDAWSTAKAFNFRKVTLDNGLTWRAQRWARFLAGFSEGRLLRARSWIGRAAKSRAPLGAASSSSA